MIAASVRTRVVSWKDAAARKLDVESDALLTPSRDCLSARVDVLELEPVEEFHQQKLGVVGLLDADLADD